MVEITNKTRQVVYFPKTYAGSTTSLNLHLHSELSQKDWFFDVQDLASLKDYYKFSVDFSTVDDGEFNYYIKADDDALDSGLIRIGVSQSNNGQYRDDDIEIVQYDMYAEPTQRLCWLEDMEGNRLINGVITLPMTGGLASVKIVCNSDDIEWSFGDMFSPFGSFLEGTGTTVISKQIGQGPQGPDFYVWQPLSSTNSGVVPGSKVRLTYEGERPSVSFILDFGHSGSACTVEQDGDNYSLTVLVSGHNVYFDIILTANTAYTINYREDLTGVFDITGLPNPWEGMGGHYMEYAAIPFHDTPRRYVFDVYSDDLFIKTVVLDAKYSAPTPPTPSGATAITLNVPSVIVGEGKATVTVEPSGADVDLYFSADESSPTEAAIDQEGNIYVLANGETTICVEDLNSGLKDCKNITCVLEPSEIYVQTLIDEGYANVVTGAGGTYIEILESCPYSAAEILDLGEVARNEKKLTGTTNNVILWDQPLPNGWTNSDITSIYSGKTLNFTPRARMFWAVDDIESLEITFAGGSYSVNDYPWGSGMANNGVFAPRYEFGMQYPLYFRESPKNLTVNFTGDYGSVAQTMFCEMGTTTALTINVNGFFSVVDWTGMYEDCYQLRTLTLNGLFRYDFSRLVHNMFKNCEKLQSVPYVVAWGRDHIQNTVRPHTQPGGSADAGGMFQNCKVLESIGLTLDLECVSLSGCVVDGETQAALSAPMIECPNLTDVRIKNLGHNSWNFVDAEGKLYAPKMDTASIEYLLNNVQDETGNGYTLTFSTLHQGQISTAAISNAQNKGWTIAWE